MSIQIPEGHCFHCGLPNVEGDRYPATILKIERLMCCPGCQAVATAIVNNGLESYYEFRTETAARGDAALDNALSQLAVYDEPELQEEFVFDVGKHKEIRLTVEGITCAACGWLIEKQLSKVKGLKQVSVNVAARRALVTWDDTEVKLSSILNRLKQIGYESLPFQSDQHEASYQSEQKSYLKKLGLAGLMTMQVMMLAMGQYFDLFGNIDNEMQRYFNWISLILTTPVVLFSGSVFYVSALKAVLAKTVNMDIPVTIAIVATYIAGIIAVNKDTGEVYFESICMFIFFLLISRFLEHRSRHKATQISSNMLKYIPVTANKWMGEKIESVLAKQLKVGDLVLVKAGETIPIDGIVTGGIAHVDESMLTGEFEPVKKQLNSMVYGGTLNQDGQISLKVTSTLKHAMVNQILRLQETALASKPSVALVADKLSRYFVIAVLAISALTYTYWSSQGNPEAFWICISILVATCPCALGLATPSALTCAMAKLNRTGILIKRADALEQLTHVTDVIFDKTGTLTEGKFTLVSKWLDTNTMTEEEILLFASSLEQCSEHPISSAFPVEQAKAVEQVEIVIGNGIKGIIDQKLCVIGSASFLSKHLSDFNGQVQQLGLDSPQEANVFFSVNKQLIAAFSVCDAVKKDVSSVIKNLDQYTTTILSGDSKNNVESIATNLGIKNKFSQCSPKQKLDYIAKLQIENKVTLMVGDGINDAPVLAASNVSVAVGNASDLARNAADVILISGNLPTLLDVIAMAKRTKRKIKQNIAWALSYNLLVLPFAMMGVLTPWQAALGMSLSSIIVVYNSTRLMR
ncbi:heavy metal translocating P-type ATPase [Glaciecola sp. KUL10]|uniref:heavy metal translocating P-type ATPase n=1 Tax=Glaciecola sp. (strain KUL10) TaxID=2161813 RepID=UPI000D784A2C|nr:heavy metal translocating P-type ATPase [Glaciecola sp. KUL10]GBL02913.1 copper-translocating P-type ATPase [Glaciecola sp. KUL10]